MKLNKSFATYILMLTVVIIGLFATIAATSFIVDKSRETNAKNSWSLCETKIREIENFNIYKFSHYGECFCVALPKSNSITMER